MEYAMTGSMIGVYAVYSFQCSTPPDSVPAFYIGFTATGKDWQFLKAREVIFLADEKRFSLGEGDYDSEINIGSTGETLAVKLDAETFEWLGKSKTVEVKAGSREFKLKNEHIEAFRDLYNLSKPTNES